MLDEWSNQKNYNKVGKLRLVMFEKHKNDLLWTKRKRCSQMVTDWVTNYVIDWSYFSQLRTTRYWLLKCPSKTCWWRDVVREKSVIILFEMLVVRCEPGSGLLLSLPPVATPPIWSPGQSDRHSSVGCRQAEEQDVMDVRLFSLESWYWCDQETPLSDITTRHGGERGEKWPRPASPELAWDLWV